MTSGFETQVAIIRSQRVQGAAGGSLPYYWRLENERNAMPNYRRAHIAGGTYFFTVVTYRRRRLFHDEANRQLLGDVIRECQQQWPFEIDAIVLLPDHLHAIWTLPAGDHNYSARWSVIKKTFTTRFLAAGGQDAEVSAGKQDEHRRGIWQRRFWEHAIEDEDDYQTHFDYIHYNPVKHNLAECPADWKWSSFHRWVKAGVYPKDWACSNGPPPDIATTEVDFGEADGA